MRVVFVSPTGAGGFRALCMSPSHTSEGCAITRGRIESVLPVSGDPVARVGQRSRPCSPPVTAAEPGRHPEGGASALGRMGVGAPAQWARDWPFQALEKKGIGHLEEKELKERNKRIQEDNRLELQKVGAQLGVGWGGPAGRQGVQGRPVRPLDWPLRTTSPALGSVRGASRLGWGPPPLHGAPRPEVQGRLLRAASAQPSQPCAPRAPGQAAASGAGAGEGHARAGAGDAAAGEGGRALQDVGGAGGQLPPAAGQAAVRPRPHVLPACPPQGLCTHRPPGLEPATLPLPAALQVPTRSLLGSPFPTPLLAPAAYAQCSVLASFTVPVTEVSLLPC